MIWIFLKRAMIILYRGSIKLFRAIMKFSHATILIVLFSILSFWMANAYFAPPDFAAYYSYTRSLLHDGDLDFSDEYEHFEFQKHMLYITGKGYLSNDWPMGAGLLWSGFYLLGSVAARFFGSETNGFSQPYFSLVLTGILFYVGSGLFAAYHFLRKRYGAKISLWSVLLCFFGTPLLFYTFYGALMSHATGFFIVTLFIIVWAETIKERTPAQWALLGALGGIMTLTRPQHIATLIVLLVEAFIKHREGAFKSRADYAAQYIKGALVAFAAFIFALLPLFFYWSKFFGNPFHMPKLEEMRWFRPAIFEMLFSDYHGLLPWTPIVLLGALGLFLLWKKERILAAGLIAALLMQIYINSANEVWWAGGSFSNRRFTEYGFIFMLGLAALFSEGRMKFWLISAILFSAWSFLLVIAERLGFNTLDHYIPWNKTFFYEMTALLVAPWRWFPALWGDYAKISIIYRIILALLLANALVFADYIAAHLKNYINRKRLVLALIITVLLFFNILVLVGVVRTRPQPPEIAALLGQSNRFLWFNYYEYGYYLLSKKRLHKALAAFQKAHDLMPSQPQPLRYLGTIYEELGDYDKAEKYYLDAFALDPKYQNVRISLDRLRAKRRMNQFR